MIIATTTTNDNIVTPARALLFRLMIRARSAIHRAHFPLYMSKKNKRSSESHLQFHSYFVIARGEKWDSIHHWRWFGARIRNKSSNGCSTATRSTDKMLRFQRWPRNEVLIRRWRSIQTIEKCCTIVDHWKIFSLTVLHPTYMKPFHQWDLRM